MMTKSMSACVRERMHACVRAASLTSDVSQPPFFAKVREDDGRTGWLAGWSLLTSKEG
jgi:hypothetical protein